MEIQNERINGLIQQFFDTLASNGLFETQEFLSDPGGIVWITEKQYTAKVRQPDGACLAYIRKVVSNGNTPGAVGIPLFKMVLIRERVLALSDPEFLHLLAHECSHIVLDAKSYPYREPACDVLAEHFFGFPKPAGSKVGYLLDAEAAPHLFE